MVDASNQVVLSSTEVRRRFGGISNMTIWRWIEAGILPSPIKINSRNFWPESVIADVVANGAQPRIATAISAGASPTASTGTVLPLAGHGPGGVVSCKGGQA